MSMTPEEAEGWARTRAKGRARFIWLAGVLQWGLFMGVVWLAVLYLIWGRDKLALGLLAAIIVCPAAGYRWGVRAWEIQERRYADTPEKGADS